MPKRVPCQKKLTFSHFFDERWNVKFLIYGLRNFSSIFLSIFLNFPQFPPTPLEERKKEKKERKERKERKKKERKERKAFKRRRAPVVVSRK